MNIKIPFLPLRLKRYRTDYGRGPKRFHVLSTKYIAGTSLIACFKSPIRAYRYLVLDQPS